MSKQNRDVKFIIYQVLYIFVIVVMTMKGADLNLMKVMPEDEAVKKTYSDSLKKYIDSLLALGLVPRIEFDSLKDIADLKVFPTPVIPTGIVLKPNEIVIDRSQLKVDEPVKDVETEKQIELQVVAPTQYTVNSIRNNNDLPLTINADGKNIITIPPKSSAQYQLGGEKEVVYVCGNSRKSVTTKENRVQKITFQVVNAGSAEKSLRVLQSTVGWRIIIDDDFVNQIDVSIKGPVKVETKGNGVYDVMLKVCASKDQFERIYGDKDAPYTVSFDVTATDRISGKKVSQQRSFMFGEW